MAISTPPPAPMRGREIVWDDSLATGNASVDAQHKELLRQLNQFTEAMAEGRGRDQLRSAVAFLDRYTQQHFKHEEGCMERGRCPLAAQNKVAHEKFLAMIAGFRQRLEEQGPNVQLVLELRNTLSDWLINHIKKIDTSMRTCSHD